jgi:hypothetical protein
MRKGTVHLKECGLLMAIITVFLITTGAVNVETTPNAPGKTGADLIMIDAMKTFGPLERPPVAFFHSRHTEALAEVKQDCSVCHMADEKGRLSPKFQRLADEDRQKATDIYHVNCITCHRNRTASGQKSGPQKCAGCHQDDPAVASTWQAAAFDRSLHYRHVKATEEKCESCHHEFDKKAQKLVYVKGKEGACVYCHKDTWADDTSPIKEASHYQCIGCHRERMAKNEKAGPMGCVGCHDADYQAGIEVVKEIPRLQRNQPDAVLVKTGDEIQPDGTRPSAMEPVPFDHLAHENYNDSCKVCHHASLESCSSCHTNAGKKEGDNVKLAQAMHSLTSTASCIGCHQEALKERQCAGCHNAIGSDTGKADGKSCKACHTKPLPGNIDPDDDQATSQFAAKLLRERNLEPRTFDTRQLPEKVVIGRLSDRFEPAEFPHDKVLKALIDGTRESKLAGHFHNEEGTLCQGCHHNSPAAVKPPSCANCHGNTVEGSDAFRPGLVGAYHQQCIGCHNSMGIEKPAARDCNACHVEKNKG